MPSPANKMLVIGIDFGTTFSGVSWLFYKPGSPAGQPQIVRRWPAQFAKNNEQAKVPSKVYYNNNTGDMCWGYKIPCDEEPLQWFKLLLLEDSDLQEDQKQSVHLKSAKTMLKDLDKTAAEVISDYLREIWKHSLLAIKRAKGNGVVDGTPIHVVLTVPAIWKDYARDRMRTAAETAGILDERLCGPTTLDLISEPEAAALATIPELGDRSDLGVGNSFIVCDCGGGTVDIISYKVVKTDPLTVKECVEGDGALCGGIFPDEGFEVFMRKTFSSKEWDRMDPMDIKKMMNNDWEHGIKAEFDGTDIQSFVVDIHKDKKRRKVRPKTSDIKNMFYHSSSGTTKLIQDQVTAIRGKTGALPKFIMLVGGFGRCQYLFSVIEQRFGQQTDVLQADGEGPWTAICRGAVLYGAMGRGLLEKTVELRSRVSRLSYGWSYHEPFNRLRHRLCDKVWDDCTGEWVALNQMKWGIKRGDDIDTEVAKTFEYVYTFDQDSKGFEEIESHIYTNTSSQPPTSLEPGCTHLSTTSKTLPVKVETLPFEELGGYRYREFHFETRMDISGASLNLSFWHKGIKFGDTKLGLALN